MQCIPNVVAHTFNRNIFLHEHRLADDKLLVEMCTCNAKLNLCIIHGASFREKAPIDIYDTEKQGDSLVLVILQYVSAVSGGMPVGHKPV